MRLALLPLPPTQQTLVEARIAALLEQLEQATGASASRLRGEISALRWVLAQG